MVKENILVPVDFSPASASALDVALHMAEKNNQGITLLHIENGKGSEDAEKQMQSTIDLISGHSDITVEKMIRKGNLFREIEDMACDDCFRLMVIGTHGFKGLREKVFGADILKLLKNIPIPVISLQKGYTLPDEGFKKILFPASTHQAFARNVQATAELASLFDGEVHIYTVKKPGVDFSENMLENIQYAKETFDKAGIRYLRITEEQESFSVGYSKQIMTYAHTNGIDIIALMTNSTSENYYFADSDKASILTNPHNIPVLCTNDR
ncbi:MAG: universal stress protein [Bacteroidetes bacterium]|nr:universal stress protein [Bacteroidota bacterium]